MAWKIYAAEVAAGISVNPLPVLICHFTVTGVLLLTAAASIVTIEPAHRLAGRLLGKDRCRDNRQRRGVGCRRILGIGVDRFVDISVLRRSRGIYRQRARVVTAVGRILSEAGPLINPPLNSWQGTAGGGGGERCAALPTPTGNRCPGRGDHRGNQRIKQRCRCCGRAAFGVGEDRVVGRVIVAGVCRW